MDNLRHFRLAPWLLEIHPAHGVPSWPTRPGRPRPPWQARYLAGSEGVAALEQPLRRQAAQVDMEQAERWIAVSDGGAGLEDFLRGAFPGAPDVKHEQPNV